MKQPRILPWNGSEDWVLAEALQVLARGGLLVLPTDTVYGIAADPRQPNSVERLWLAKGRPANKPIALLAADSAQVEQWPVRLSPLARCLAQRYWPGALTLVVDGADQTAAEGFRVPDHAATRLLLQAAGTALRVSSANRNGAPPALSAQAAAEALGPAVDLVLDGGTISGGQPSTVVRVTGKTLSILRPGAIPESQILATGRAWQREAAPD